MLVSVRAQTWLSFLSLLVVSSAFPSPAVAHNARNHLRANRVKRHNGLIEPRDLQDFNLNSADVFPADLQSNGQEGELDKRLLGELLNGVGDLVNTVVNVLVGNNGQTTTQTIITTQQVTTTQQAAPTSAAGVTNNGGSPTTTPNAGNTPAPASTPSSTPNNGSGNSASPSNASQGGNASTDAKDPGNTSVSGSSGTVAPINNGGSVSITSGFASGSQSASSVVTDHFGNTVTGTAPVTQTWLTTLPDGVVSTVTATFTPGTPDTDPSATHQMTGGKIAAIVGTIVAMFIVVFSCALVMLLIRKRTRAIQLTRSRPNSAGSFDSFTNGDADERRDSRVGLTVGTMSSRSFKTASAFIDGNHMEFPLPPAPETSAAGAARPLSDESGSSEFGFAGQMSRASLIEDRNQFRKIGQYPAAGSYTPFAFPPSSDLGHSEEGIHCTYSPTAMAFAIEQRLNSVPEKSFNQDYTSSRSETPASPAYENPFTDPSPASTTPTTPAAGVRNSLLGNSGARRTSLWRTATFGGSDVTTIGPVPPPRKTKVLPLSQSDELSQRESEPRREPTIDLTRESSSSSSGARRSFYSASESLKEELRVSQMYQGENPFADPQTYVASRPKTPQSTQGQGINYPVLRPGTNGTTSSVTSSAVDSDFARRDLGESPDPNGSGLFWPTSRPSTGQTPLSGQP